MLLVAAGVAYFVNGAVRSMMGDVGYLLIVVILGGVFYKPLYAIMMKVAAYAF